MVMNNLEQFVHKEFIKQELEFSELYHYLDKYMKEDIFNLPDLEMDKDIKVNRTIWILWMQGMENAPLLVKKCYESVHKYKPENYDLIVLTEENLDKYIKLPQYIWDKYKTGIISVTHLSDIIRIELLCAYGGCWIDSTVFCMNQIPSFMLSGNMFMFKLQGVVTNPVLKMSSWWIYTKKNNRIMNAVRSVLHEYWRDENDIQNYFLLHILMSKIIDEDSSSKAIFEAIPYFNSGNAHVLWAKMEQPYVKSEFDMIKQISIIQKLSYKKRFLKGDVYNYYNAIIDIPND